MLHLLVFIESTLLVISLQLDIIGGQGCSWIATFNSNTYGGTVKPGISTVDGCKSACTNAPPCSAVDFNGNGDGNGNLCWLSQPGATVNSGIPGVTHYAYVCSSTVAGGSYVSTPGVYTGPATSANPSANPSGVSDANGGSCYWNSTANSNSLGGSQTNQTTLGTCQNACLQQSNCTGVDWDPTNTNGKPCWFSTTPIINYNGANGVTHYQYICPGGSSVSNTNCWNMSISSYSPAGTPTNFTTLADCQKNCRKDSSCLGIDWLPAGDTKQQCYFSQFNYIVYGTYPGSYHFNYICSGYKTNLSSVFSICVCLFAIIFHHQW